jgi:hypothetical protein
MATQAVSCFFCRLFIRCVLAVLEKFVGRLIAALLIRTYYLEHDIQSMHFYQRRIHGAVRPHNQTICARS